MSEQARRRAGWPPWITPVLTGVFIVTTTVAGSQVSGTEGRMRAWWVVAQAVTAMLAFTIPTIANLRTQRRFQASQEARIAARTEMRVAMNDALDPVVRHIGRIAAAEHRRDRLQLQAQAVPFVLTAATAIIGAERTRACWYVLEDGRPRVVRPVTYVGRAGRAHTEFVEGTRAGDAVLAMIEQDQVQYFRDVKVAPPPGWDPTLAHDYRTFVSVPAIAGDVAYGMLTLDSLHPGDLTRDDARLLRLLAGLLADALAIE